MSKTKEEIDKLVYPFQKWVKRYGYMYLEFLNGKCLMSNDLKLLIEELSNDDYEIYCSSVENWCLLNCT